MRCRRSRLSGKTLASEMKTKIIFYSLPLILLAFVGYTYLWTEFEMGCGGQRYVIGELPDGFSVNCILANGLNARAVYRVVTIHTPDGPIARRNLLSEELIVTGEGWRWQLPEYSQSIKSAQKHIDYELERRHLSAMTDFEVHKALNGTPLRGAP